MWKNSLKITITIKFYTKPYSIFLQRNGTYVLNKPRNSAHFGIPKSLKGDHYYIASVTITVLYCVKVPVATGTLTQYSTVIVPLPI